MRIDPATGMPLSRSRMVFKVAVATCYSAAAGRWGRVVLTAGIDFGMPLLESGLVGRRKTTGCGRLTPS